jgi:hypothetical protein
MSVGAFTEFSILPNRLLLSSTLSRRRAMRLLEIFAESMRVHCKSAASKCLAALYWLPPPDNGAASRPVDIGTY